MFACRSLFLVWLGFLTALGCHGGLSPRMAADVSEQEALVLNGNYEEMRRKVLRRIPIGTAIEDARQIVTASGFECIETHLPDGPALVCWRTNGNPNRVQYQWRIVMLHDEEQIRDVSVRAFGFSRAEEHVAAEIPGATDGDDPVGANSTASLSPAAAGSEAVAEPEDSSPESVRDTDSALSADRTAANPAGGG